MAIYGLGYGLYTLPKNVKKGVFSSAFFRIQTEYGDLLCKSLHLFRILEHKDQTRKNSIFGYFSCSNIPVLNL